LLLTQQGRLHDLDEIGLGGILSQRFAQFLVNVQLQEQAARAQAALELLAAAAGVVEGDLDVGGRATFIARLAVPQLADHAEVYLADRFKHGLRFAGGAHGDPRTAADLDHVAWPVVDPAGPTDVAHAFRTGRLTPSRDADRDSSHVLPQDSRLRTALASRAKLNIPLPGPNGPIGVLVLGLRGTRRFRPEDARLGRELARVAAPALNNALRFEQERLTGVTLQRSLLPRDVPAVAGARVATRYVPSTAGLEVGGDWYDVVELPDGELLLAIGDVAGHSIEAAVSMGRYRTVLQFAAAEGLEPAEMLRRINEFMVTAFPSEMATLCIVSYDPRAGVATAASAGHLPPVITLPDGSTRIWSVKPGLPLGVVANVDFEQESIAMEPQTFLVLYTDGLVERRGETLDTGIARLRECCGRRFGSPEELADDDVALLVAEVTLAGADFHLRFRADAAQLASLRRDLRRWLGAVPPLQERIEDVVLAANEAVANAIEHAYADVPAGPVTVRGHLGEHDLALSVTDRGRWRAPGTDSSRGRGLELMGTLSDEVDVRRSETGSTVVFRFAFAAPAEN
jgi:anti-sigma regulatory factor (Ser/Thr protein kinase)